MRGGTTTRRGREVLVLLGKAEPSLEKLAHPNLGRLVGPRDCGNVAATAERGVPWAADNDCFGGLDAPAFRRMVGRLPVDGCLFVTVPDVVGDHRATVRRWGRWAGFVTGRGFPAAFVAQDGIGSFGEVPEDASALFVGGSTRFKMSGLAAELVGDARRAGRWAHMGRVNSVRRIRYARSVGCQSVDGTGWSVWTDTKLPRALDEASSPVQGSLLFEASLEQSGGGSGT